MRVAGEGAPTFQYIKNKYLRINKQVIVSILHSKIPTCSIIHSISMMSSGLHF